MKNKIKLKKENNDEEVLASRLLTVVCVLLGLLFVFIGERGHEAISWLGYLCFLGAFLLFMDHDKNLSFGGGDRARIPSLYANHREGTTIPKVDEAEEAFIRNGFTNIKRVALGDIKKRSIFSDDLGYVSYITINGKRLNPAVHEEAPKDALIVIAYHSEGVDWEKHK